MLQCKWPNAVVMIKPRNIMKQIIVVQHSSGGNAMKLEVALVHCIGASSTAKKRVQWWYSQVT